MATHHVNLSFTIYVNDPGYFNELLVANFYDPDTFDGFARAPMEAAATVGHDLFLREHWPTDIPIPIDITVNPFRTPSIRSDVLQPNVPSGTYPIDVIQFKRCTGGWFGVCWLFGDTTIYTWIPHYEYSPPPVPVEPVPPVPVAMPLRRWIDGAELPLQGEGQQAGSAPVSRRASRHTQGMGYFFDNIVATRVHAHTENGAAVSPGAWERLYVRISRFPDTPTRIWSVTNTITQGGPMLTLTAGGSLGLSDFNGINAATPIATFANLLLDVWYKLDIVYAFGANSGGFPYVKGYLNGTRVVNISGGALVNMVGATKNCSLSTLGGGDIGGSANNAIWHADDWICSEVPNPTYEIGGCADFIHGSRVALVGAKGFAVNHASWLGDWRLTRQRPVTIGVPTQLTCNVSGALLSVTTDALTEIDTIVNALGIAALNVGLYSDKGGAGANGNLGYAFNGGTGLTLGPVVQNFGGYSWTNRLYRGGTIAPLTPMAGLELVHQKGASTDPAKVQALLASAEIIGVFGEEDVYPAGATGLDIADPPSGSIAPHLGIHNAPYPHTVWAQKLQPPESLVVVKTGQYTGNGTFQDLKFRVPVQFLWVRPASGSTGGVQWWSSMCAAHIHGARAWAPDTLLEVLIDNTFVPGAIENPEGNMDLEPAPDNLEQALAESNALAYGFAKNTADYEPWTHYLEDPDYYWKRMLGWQSEGGPDEAVAGLYAVPPSPWLSTQMQQTLVRLAGNNAESNAPGVLYNYLAFCDPGMRFCSAGGLKVVGFLNDFDTALDDVTFTPESAFLQLEQQGSNLTQTLMFKGLGSTGTTISVLTLAEIASGLAFAAGKLTYKSGLANASGAQDAYLCWRRNDASGDANIVRVLQLLTYTGDGTAARTLNLTPASGRRPMWAIIVGHNGTAVYRDPYHTGTASTQFPITAAPTTGITAGGIDQIMIGLLVNANGIKYDVLAFPGPDCVGNNGWGCAGEVIPVAPIAPPGGGDGPWNPPPPEPPPPPGGGGQVCSTAAFPIDPDV